MTRVRRRHRSHQVDRALKRAQPSGPEPPVDRSWSQAAFDQLLPCGDPMLPDSKIVHGALQVSLPDDSTARRLISPVCAVLTPHMTGNPARSPGAPGACGVVVGPVAVQLTRPGAELLPYRPSNVALPGPSARNDSTALRRSWEVNSSANWSGVTRSASSTPPDR